MDPLAIATFVLAGVTAVSVVVIALDGTRARRHESAERQRQREYDRAQNAYAKLRGTAVLALQLRSAMKLWPLTVTVLPAVIRGSAVLAPKYAERLRDMEATIVYSRFWSGPPWQKRSDQLAEAIVEAAGWVRPLRGELDEANRRALDAAGEKLGSMMTKVALPWTARHLVNEYLRALEPVLDELERRLSQQTVERNTGRR